jgi:hypothetical protein
MKNALRPVEERRHGNNHGVSLRRVRIVKMKCRDEESSPAVTEREGWEQESPRVGVRYALYLDNGNIFHTSTVQSVDEAGFYTSNSMYRLELLTKETTDELQRTYIGT